MEMLPLVLIAILVLTVIKTFFKITGKVFWLIVAGLIVYAIYTGIGV